jgi:hypothetical protein
VIFHSDHFAGRDNLDGQAGRRVLGQLRPNDAGLSNQHNSYAQLTGSQDTAFNLRAGRIVTAHGVNSNRNHRII